MSLLQCFSIVSGRDLFILVDQIKDVTVGIPVYKGTINEEFIKSIESIINQTVKPREIQVVQDGAIQDILKDTINYFLNREDIIKHILIPAQSGLAYALNVSILNCNTPYYARMDSDDLSHPDRLKRQIEYLDNNPDVDIVGTWAVEFEEDINNPNNLIRKVPTGLDEIRRLFHYRNPLNHPTIMFRRSVFAKIGLYNPAFIKAQDTELYARALKNDVGMANIPEVLYYLRVKGVMDRRATKEHLKYQILGRYKYNTWSLKLNVLKLLSIMFRFLPKRVQKYAYKLYRW